MLLSDAIGTRRRTYHALDLGVTLSINAVRLTTNIPVFFNSKIEGFSRGQLIAGFGLAASIPVNDVGRAKQATTGRCIPIQR